MEHDEAIRLQAPEKYAAGELSPAEQHAFEDHFFDCPTCAGLLREELVIAANLRAALRETPSQPQPSGLAGWLASLRARPALTLSFALNGILAVGLGIMLITGPPNAPAPRLIPAYFAPGTARDSGDEEVHAIPVGIPSFLAHIPLPDQQYASYSYEILDPQGKRESAGAVDQAQEQDVDLYLEVPLKGLPEGVHTLEVRGNPGGKVISRSKFHISR